MSENKKEVFYPGERVKYPGDNRTWIYGTVIRETLIQGKDREGEWSQERVIIQHESNPQNCPAIPKKEVKKAEKR